MSDTKTLTAGDLQPFTGSENWYRHALNRSVLFTDGAKFLADKAGAYWLLDQIALAQKYDRRVAAEGFQFWKLIVEQEDRSAVLTCDDGNGVILYREEIGYTDFPLAEVKLYVANKTIMLPSEY